MHFRRGDGMLRKLIFIYLLKYRIQMCRLFLNIPRNADSLKVKSPFLIPVNLKGDMFPDARIFVNNDTTFCFPFFDTCVGQFSVVSRIKIDFGNGFQSRWINMKLEKGRKVLPVAKTGFVFTLFKSFKRRRYKFTGSELKLLTSGQK